MQDDEYFEEDFDEYFLIFCSIEKLESFLLE